MRRTKFFKRKCEYWLISALVGLARLLPRWVGRKVFSWLGLVAPQLFPRDRQRAVDNLGIAFPESHRMVREAMARAMFKTLGANAFDFLQLKGASPERLGELVTEVHGLQRLEEAMGRGRGLIAITGHIGCWELMPAYFVSRGYPTTVVARRMRSSRLDDKLNEIRASLGVKTLDRDSSPRSMLKVLRSGEALGVLIDQHTRVSGAYVPFFNRPAYTPIGVAKLACLTGAPILPMAIFANRMGTYEVHILDPIDAPAEGRRRDEVIHELTAQCSRAIEQLIRIDPKQWVWFHHRWREPEGSDVHYAAQA